jgi:hypothetical protein
MGLLVRLGRLFQLVAVVAVASATLMATGAGAQAAQSYGPPVPVPPGIPGGFFTVVTTVTICPPGGTIGPVRADGLVVTIRVPAGAFRICHQVTITSPNVAGIGNAGFPGFRAIGGVGVFIGTNGVKFRGSFLRPVTLTMSSAAITAASIVVRWNGSSFVRAGGAVTAGSATVAFQGDPAFAVLRPTGHKRHHHHHHHHRRHHHKHHHHHWGAAATATKHGSAGGTTALAGDAALAADTITGARKPLVAEIFLAAGLLLAGTGGFAYARRRRSGADRMNASRD